MVSLTTPSGQLGWPAASFDLPGTDGKQHSLGSVRGTHGTVIMFICNHCPYVRAVVDKIVRDMPSRRPRRAQCGHPRSNDPAGIPGGL
jgi:hypothetical protein